MKPPLRVGFVVQGEGRGHMTQALALAAFLRDAGHEVARVWIGRSRYRTIPDYFVDGIGAPVETFDAPVQVPDRRRVGASPARTLADAVRRAPAFWQSARRIREGVERLDLVVNFLDVLGAAALRWAGGQGTPSVAVAHNYWFLHPGAGPLPGSTLTQAAVLGWMRATAAGSDMRLALSFAPAPPAASERLEVVPPLLRPGIADLVPRDGGFLLAYALNPGYGTLLVEWQRRRPDVPVRCYVDGGAAALAEPAGPGFEPLPLDQGRFLDDLAACRAFVGTAGFEAVCESFHLGKPTLAVPTEGQYEQVLNAWDAERHGAARAGSYADLDRFWDALPTPGDAPVAAFRRWVARAPSLYVEALERASRRIPLFLDSRRTRADAGGSREGR